MTKLYLRPQGLVYGNEALHLVKAGLAGRLAGGFAGFTAVEVITRDRREWRTYADIAASRDGAIGQILARIEAPRADFAGLSMASPVIMGIINVTPDSFSDGGQAAEHETAIAQGRRLWAEGARILDVGGESTRPGSDLVPAREELARVLPVLAALRAEDFRLSVDTRKPEVMQAAAQAGAGILNDVSALGFSPDSPAMAARLKLPLVLMHAQGDPKTMQLNPFYEDVALDVYDALEVFISRAVAAGVPRSLLAVDPGIGFGKSFAHNLEVLNQLSLYHGLGVPVLLGASRKAFIGAITGESQAANRMAGSVGVALAAVAQGAQIIRVHDVRETSQALASWMAVNARVTI
jgi:dihydropteroate synthase